MWWIPVRNATRAAVTARNTDCNANRSTQAESRRCATIAKQVSRSSAAQRSTSWEPRWGAIWNTSASKNVKEHQRQQRQDERDAQELGHPEQAQLGEHGFDDADQHRQTRDLDEVGRQADPDRSR